MEPNQMDQWIRQAVQKHEFNASLEQKQSDRLWRKLRPSSTPSFIWLWKAASVLLLFGVIYLLQQVTSLSKQNKQLALSYVRLEEKQTSQTKQREQTMPTVVTKTDTVVQVEKQIETVVQYVPKEVIVYQDRENVVSSNVSTDSLLKIIEQQQKQLAELNDVPAAQPLVNHSIKNIEVAFDQSPDVVGQQMAQHQGMKFQFSFLKRK